MNREVITVTEFDIAPLCYEYYWETVEDELYNEYFDGDGNFIKHHFSNDFDVVDEIVDYYDLEKSYEKKTTIVERKSDRKCFAAKWTSGYYENLYPNKLTEVFPKQVEITVYE